MKSHHHGRLRLLALPLLIATAALASTLAFSAASSASSHPPAASGSPLAGAITSTLYQQGLRISTPAARIGPHVSRQAAVAVARAQPIAPYHGVSQVALAHVTFYRIQPATSGLFWVISLKPSGNVPSNGVPHRHIPPVKARYYVVVVSAATGHFFWATIGG